MVKVQEKIMEFQKAREQLLVVSSRKQQLQMQASMVQNALKELNETSQEKVYKLVGNILIEKNTKDVKKELEELKNQLDARIETLQKQEDSLINRLNKLKEQIEEAEKKKE